MSRDGASKKGLKAWRRSTSIRGELDCGPILFRTNIQPFGLGFVHLLCIEIYIIEHGPHVGPRSRNSLGYEVAGFSRSQPVPSTAGRRQKPRPSTLSGSLTAAGGICPGACQSHSWSIPHECRGRQVRRQVACQMCEKGGLISIGAYMFMIFSTQPSNRPQDRDIYQWMYVTVTFFWIIYSLILDGTK